MAVPTVNVTTHVEDSEGAPINGARVHFSLNRVDVDDGLGYVVPNSVTGTTDVLGDVVMAVWPNELGATESSYEVTIVAPNNRTITSVVATIPNSACNLWDVANLPVYPGKTDGQLAVDVAGVHAANASASAGNAATSETNAATSETNAATSETNAATSETNAAASYDSFDDRYLGSKASAPTLDNDGDALLTGAMYWDSSNDEMRIYDGAAWNAVSTAATAVTYNFTATSEQTTFTGNDDNAKTLSYTPGFIIVGLDGAWLDVSEYTATNGSSIVLSSAANLNSELQVLSFGTFDIANLDLSNSTITGATIEDSPIGGATPNTGAFTTFSSTAIDASAADALAITIDANENVGIGVTPEAWQSAYTALQIGGNSSIMSQTATGVSNSLYSLQNAYYDGAWKYQNTAEASRYQQVLGTHSFKVAVSGTADTAISWVDALTIDNSANATFGGKVTVNAPTNDWGLEIEGGVTANQSNGINIDAGTSASDIAFRIRDGAGTSTALTIRGDLNATFGGEIISSNTGGLTVPSASTAKMGSASNAGLLLAGSGTTDDVRILNKNLTNVITIATGTTSTTFGGNVSLANNKILELGTASGLQIKHDGNGSISNYTGFMVLATKVNSQLTYLTNYNSSGVTKNCIITGGATPYVRLYYDSSQVFETVSAGVRVGDSQSYYCGAGNDLLITHNGSNSNITNSTGTLYFNQVVNSGTIEIKTDNSGGTARTCAIFGGVAPHAEFYHEGNLRLSTAASGVDIANNSQINMNQTTSDTPFFNFQATVNADAVSAISSLTTSGATTHHIQVDINGVKAWIAVSTTDPT